MPIYAYRCQECGAEQDEFNKISDRESGAPECHGVMQPFITPTMISAQEDCHYICPETGKGVTSWQQRKNIFAEHGLIDARGLDYKKRIEEKDRKVAERKEFIKKHTPNIDLTPYIPRHI